MMKTRFSASVLSAILCLAAGAFGGRLSFQEHAAVQESLSRVHPRMRASWLKERGIEDPYYTSVKTDSGSGLRCIGRWSYGPSYDVDGRVTPSETLVALARGSGVSLLRFSRHDSLSIELLSDINAEGLMCRVKVVDALLYVGSRKGLETYNIADEQNPVRLSWTPIPLNDFALQDSLAYTISGDNSFRIYNVSDPASPVLRGSCTDSGDVVSVAGGAAFVGGRWGLYVLDVTNPASPHRIGSWGSAIEQVEARGHLCYVTTFNPNVPGEITFHILDVAVPSLPYQIGSLDSAGGRDVYLIDTLAFGAGEEDFSKMTVMSVADSTRPRLLGSAGKPGWGTGVWASGLVQAAFVGSHWEGLQIYDTRNTSQPVRDTFLLGADEAVDIFIDNSRAYVADWMSGLKILDVSDPASPTALGAYDSAGQMPSMATVVARDSFAFADWFWFRVVDVSDPAHPKAAGQLDPFNPPEDMVIRDSFVYVAEINKFQIVNVARPREPVLVGSCVGDGVAVVVQDTFAYTASGAIRITNIARPDSPFVVGTIADHGASGLAVRDTFLYAPYAYDTLFTYSVVDPARPRLLTFTPLGVWPKDVVLGRERAYVALNGAQGIEVLDLANPGHPVSRGQASAPYCVRRLCYDNGLVYAALWEAGVAFYETTAVGIGEQVPVTGRPGALRIWPSVTGDKAHFTVGAAPRFNDIAVFDISGERLNDVLRQVCVKGSATTGAIDLSGLAAGVYVVRVKSEGKSFTARVVKINGR